jgi:hypothetical protein
MVFELLKFECVCMVSDRKNDDTGKGDDDAPPSVLGKRKSDDRPAGNDRGFNAKRAHKV